MRRGIKFENRFKYGFTALGTGTWIYKTPDKYTAFLEFKKRTEEAYHNYKLFWNNDNTTYTLRRSDGWGASVTYTDHILKIWELPIEHPKDVPF